MGEEEALRSHREEVVVARCNRSTVIRGFQSGPDLSESLLSAWGKEKRTIYSIQIFRTGPASALIAAEAEEEGARQRHECEEKEKRAHLWALLRTSPILAVFVPKRC